MKKYIVLLLVLALGACTVQIRDVDVTGSQELVVAHLGESDIAIREIIIENFATDIENVSTTFGKQKNAFLNNYSVKTFETVENDLRLFLDESFVISDNSDLSLRVSIRRANAYVAIPAADNMTGIGMFTVWHDHQFGILLDVLFEIEINKKVVRSYRFDEEYKLVDGKAATRKRSDESYARLIALYRERMYPDLLNNFLARYF